MIVGESIVGTKVQFKNKGGTDEGLVLACGLYGITFRLLVTPVEGDGDLIEVNAANCLWMGRENA